MKKIKFKEILNDLVSYFLLGDIATLNNFKVKNNLPNDLATEFTTTDIGDKVVHEGILIPLSGIENYPYTIIFNSSENEIELLKKENDLQIRESGYVIKIESGELTLFTWHFLKDFTGEDIKLFNKPTIKLENGWYKVEIFAGQTMQKSGLEPTFEFVIQKIQNKENCRANIFRSYKIKSDQY